MNPLTIKPQDQPSYLDKLNKHANEINKNNSNRQCFTYLYNKIFRNQSPILDLIQKKISVSPAKYNEIPYDIIRKVCHSCDDWNEIRALRMTCKNFYFGLRKAKFLSSWLAEHPPVFNNLSSLDLYEISKNTSGLEKITFCGGSFTIQSFISFLKYSPHLTSLSFQNFDKNIDDFICALALYAPGVQHLSISDCPLSDQSLYALIAANYQLDSLHIHFSNKKGALTDYGFYPFLYHCKNLESLCISGCPLVTQLPLFLLQYPADEVAPLKNLAFLNCGMIDHLFFEKINLEHIESLEIEFHDLLVLDDASKKSFQDAFIDFGEETSNLKKLKINGCKWLDDKETMPFFLSLLTSQLTDLELRKSNPLTLNFVEEALGHPLQSFIFEPSHLELDQFPKPVFSHSLQKLNLINCPISPQSQQKWIQNSIKGLEKVLVTNDGGGYTTRG
ncbi:MAG: hypothetical protein LW832_01305 [Parachlamydia sp.]|jgi:hypothetical protein|nr:hypothetical protein [Parachlamydia sp.]